MRHVLSWAAPLVLAVGLPGPAGGGEAGQRSCDFAPARSLGAVNGPGFDGSPTVSADERELFFVSDRGGQQDLFTATRPRRDGRWSVPRNLGAVVNDPKGGDFSLRLSRDGRSLYFASIREGGFGKADLYVATRPRASGPFTRLANLGPRVNTADFEAFPTPGPDGNTLYFNRATTFDNPDSDIWVARRSGPDAPWGEPERLPAPVNSATADFSPSLTPDGLTLYFASTREGNLGAIDIWVSTRARANDPWGAPRNLGASVNTAAGLTLAPFVSEDGRRLYFMSARPESVGTSACTAPVCFDRFDLYFATCR